MTTNYDPIAEQYQRSKQQPWRTYIESFSLLRLIGDPTGQAVLDVACGEGFYTRMVRQRGASRVTGVDLSPVMIELARQQEARHRQGIEFLVADARAFQPADKYDLAIAAYLLNYAKTWQELQAMCDGIARCLKPGGRFITVNGSPQLHFPSAPSYRPYGFETSVVGEWREGAPITWKFHLDDGPFEIENYHLDVDIHETALRNAGFRHISWQAPELSPDGLVNQDRAYWSAFLDHPPIVLLECQL